MDTARAEVVLVGLDGLTVSLLRQALADDEWASVVTLPEDAAPDALPREHRVIVLVHSRAAMWPAAAAVPHPDNVIATLVVSTEPPGSDVYVVLPAGRDVSAPELAQLVRDLASDGVARAMAMSPIRRDLTRSQP